MTTMDRTEPSSKTGRQNYPGPFRMSTSATEQADRHATERRIPVAAMLAFTKEAFRACGLPEADADIVAKAVIEA
ncbi:MAG: hypothetical protein ACJ8FM_22665, partial [Xanthobacteraceae bacterium]